MKNILIVFALILLAGCKTSDEEIRSDIAGKAQEDLNFAGLTYTVKNGVVNFFGKCASDKALEKVRRKIETIGVIKGTNYNVSIAPVTIDAFTPVRLQVDSVLGSYPLVVATVDSTGAVLRGQIKPAKKDALLSALRKLPLKSIKDSLDVSNN